MPLSVRGPSVRRLGLERTRSAWGRAGRARVEGSFAMPVDFLPATCPQRVAWNKGRIVGQKMPLQPKHVWSIRLRLEIADTPRDLALFNMAIDSKLRGCDLVHLRVRDVFAAGRVKERASITQRKTGRPVRFEITEQTRQSVECWIANPEMVGADFLWPPDWSAESVAVHGIGPEALAIAEPAVSVARRFAALLAGRTIVSDAPEFDGRWLGRLLELMPERPPQDCRLRRPLACGHVPRGAACRLCRPCPCPDATPCWRRRSETRHRLACRPARGARLTGDPAA